MTSISILTPGWPEYELIDSGDSRKLERFGKYRIVRHEPKAWWRPALPEREWAKAHAAQDEEGRLTVSQKLPDAWSVRLDLSTGNEEPALGITLEARVSQTSRHIGLFPEQAPHWRLVARLGRELRETAGSDAPRPRLLNLFGYTGAASLAAQAGGFSTTHVDASRPAIAWAKRNQELSGLADDPVRFLLDDVVKFVQREKRRGNRYEAILLDPPSFGRGPNREVWKVEGMIRELLHDCRELLSDRARLVLLTMYNIEASALMLGNLMDDVLRGMQGTVSVGELAVPHTAPGAQARFLPRSLFARWER
ncbi:23S rRNA (cytosine1962-C5)-methyltransferase [Humidesulfovibrio mexicanus]|uniref:23S rRNA (Cytosine1962-C5)-methyltransferase n=1 Tax=Humidesulfovibrio mexicanus TaxID=147047 RepID=A0A238ZEG8_9BACT|nr:class I SAM-dependent methyltransferase [Humidesulfovibrio mexicanus]SNR81906.1 23S rRNA (cytosine1962-C5)-methyltransferase [Humidesulfovibrio mexicanus]